jgi:hypothetical protein
VVGQQGQEPVLHDPSTLPEPALRGDSFSSSGGDGGFESSGKGITFDEEEAGYSSFSDDEEESEGGRICGV